MPPRLHSSRERWDNTLQFGAKLKGGERLGVVLNFSQSLQAELGPRGIYVQALLPAATRTEIWARSGRDVMEVGELVDGALVGFHRHETITIPWLPDVDQWEKFCHGAAGDGVEFRQEHPALRYRA
jgi:hypothetical protein